MKGVETGFCQNK